jgi:hypothetical protein
LSINSSTGNINLNASTSGNHTVTYTIAAGNGCPAVLVTANLIITLLPAATINYPGSPYCPMPGTANVVRTGTAGGTYSSAPVGLIINASTGAINIGVSNIGTYTVTYTIPAGAGCPQVMVTTSVTIGDNSRPTQDKLLPRTIAHLPQISP